MAKQVKLTDEILTPKKEVKLTKEEQKQAKEKEAKARVQISLQQEQIKKIAQEFFNEKLLPLDVPAGLVQDVPNLLKQLIDIYVGSTVEEVEVSRIRRRLGATNFKDLDVVLGED